MHTSALKVRLVLVHMFQWVNNVTVLLDVSVHIIIHASSPVVTPTTSIFWYSLQLQVHAYIEHRLQLYCIALICLKYFSGKMEIGKSEMHGKNSVVQWHGMKLI